MTPARPATGADVAKLRRAAEAIGSGEPLAELSLAVVGARFDNKRKRGKPTGNRMSEILMCEPGEPVSLQEEPTNPHDAQAIMVVSSRGVQLGYVAADRTAVLRLAAERGQTAIAIFQEATPYGAAIRVGFDVMPTLPARAESDRRAPAARPRAAGAERTDWDGVDWIPPDE